MNTISFPKSYCVFDLETTDLDVVRADIVEIGAKKVIRDIDGTVKEEETRTWLIDIGRDLPPITTEITGITTEEMRKDGVPYHKALVEFAAMSRGLPFIGHNIHRFDIPILRNVIPRVGGAALSDFAYQIRGSVDTAGLYKAEKLGERQRWYETHEDHVKRVLEIRMKGLKYNLLHCCEQLRIDTTGMKAHRAEGDVRMVDALYRKLVGLS